MFFELPGSRPIRRGLKSVFAAPSASDETIKVEGWPEVHRRRLFIMKGRITHADGTPAAEATAELMLAK